MRRTHRPSRGKFKTLSSQVLLGQGGINLIEEIVLKMKSTWSPTGQLEVGIDGFIELFDPATGAPLGTTLAVQSKAVSAFDIRDGKYIDFHCDRRHVEYWLHGNMPVVLIVSRPDTREAYWISIKDYFAGRRITGTITFNRLTQRFTDKSLSPTYS